MSQQTDYSKIQLPKGGSATASPKGEPSDTDLWQKDADRAFLMQAWLEVAKTWVDCDDRAMAMADTVVIQLAKRIKEGFFEV